MSRRGEEREAFNAWGSIFHGFCALRWVKNKPGGGTTDSLFKGPLPLHTMLKGRTHAFRFKAPRLCDAGKDPRHTVL